MSSSGKPPRTSGAGRGRRGRSNRAEELSDEDVLIAFMPFMRNGDAEAARVHERYGHDQRVFVHQARLFIQDQKGNEAASSTATQAASTPAAAPVEPTAAIPSSPASPPSLSRQVSSTTATPVLSPEPGRTPFPTPSAGTPTKHAVTMGDLTDRMNSLGAPGGPLFMQHSLPGIGGAVGGTTIPSMPAPPFSGPTSPSAAMAPIGSSRSPGTIGRAISSPSHSLTGSASPLSSPPFGTPPPMAAAPSPSLVSSMPSLSPGLVPPAHVLKPKDSSSMLDSPPPTRGPPTNWSPSPTGTRNNDPPSPPVAPTPAAKTPEPPKEQPAKREYQPKRLWTRIEQQPGRLLTNNVPPNNQKAFRLRPRQELTAKWILPLSYLRERTQKKHGDSISTEELSLKQALEGLAVGLFRQGCTENGANVSIISKEIISPPEESREDYPFEVDTRTDTVWGKVPFYSPRTPGHVVMRLYWQDEGLYTLATGPRLFVCVSNNADVEPTLRFILSNFKAKSKTNSTSLSSLHSLAAVLEQFNPPREPRQNANNNYRRWEGAGRAAWGGICESKKVMEACAGDYLKAKEKYAKLEVEVDELQAQVEAQEQENEQEALVQDQEPKELTETEEKFREKKKTLMSGRASMERRWKDAQMAFASILKAVVNNSAVTLLLKRDLLSELRLEYELWCPLCESFAPDPFCSSGDEASSARVDALCVNRNLLPRPITGEHFRMFVESRVKMQMATLGFKPNAKRLEDVLMPGLRNANNKLRSPNGGPRSNPQFLMDPSAVGTFNLLTASMCKLYEDVYLTSDRIHQERELVRSQIEGVVAQCSAFPPGTKVVVFGSAANGFGSPTSDLDMCLQLPSNTEIPKQSEDEENPGARAMAELAELLEQAGLLHVDTARLTARIPVIKFYFPRHAGADGQEGTTLECDLSMQNPLACLNTALLLNYSSINPMTNVLASIIKRWAKNRDMNDPSRHTLSSYGYILMLLHFLTFHQSFGNGQVTSLTARGATSSSSSQGGSDPHLLEKPPLLPNLQWMDMRWPTSPPGTPYKELTVRPNHVIRHPSEKQSVVNGYFYRLSLSDPEQAAIAKNLKDRFSNKDASVAILLARFFRYYAYEFDYKRHVVSLHSTASCGLVEREVKAELDGWKIYVSGLAIEDPFETFYDVAHVVKGGSFYHLRKELALAYTKIVDAASFGAKRQQHGYGSSNGNSRSEWHDKDLSSMTGMDLIDWICEPVASGKDE